LYNFGRADLIKKDASFLKIVKKLCEIAELPIKDDENTDGKSLLTDCSEATLYNYGYLAYLKLWKELYIEGVLEECQSSTKIEYSLPETVFLMAAQHLLEPRSKLSTYLHQNRYFNMVEIPLHTMYRSLEILDKRKEDIENGLFEYNYVRINKTVDVVFYDVTTFEFESVNADELRDFGFSKACKFKEVQVVMGMIIDANGMPIGYELFEGNTFDGKTVMKALENIKKRFGINRVIIVADRGLNSKGNLNLIKEAGYGYIMSSKIRGMSKAMQAKILDTEGFTVVNDKSGNEDFRYKTMEYTNVFIDEDKVKHFLSENLIISYSPKRANKDKKDRERLVEKAKKLLENPETINALIKRGGRKYLNRNKSVIAKSLDAKSVDAKSLDSKSLDSKSLDAKSSDAKSSDAKSVDAKSVDAKSVDTKSVDTKSGKEKSKKSKPRKNNSETNESVETVTWELALEKIEQDAKFDGYYGIQTSEKNMTATDVMEAYHTLWKIEESFRIMKTTMEVRPVFHWSPKRIRGHFVLCFLAFLMERKMELLLKNEKDEVISSPQRIQEALNTMQLAGVTANNEEVFIKAKTDPLCNKIFKLMKINMPHSISKKSELIDRFQLAEEPGAVQMTIL
jgi:transposase